MVMRNLYKSFKRLSTETMGRSQSVFLRYSESISFRRPNASLSVVVFQISERVLLVTRNLFNYPKNRQQEFIVATQKDKSIVF